MSGSGREAAASGGMALLQPVRDERRELDAAVRSQMEQSLSASFGDVVVHTGASSAAVAEQLDAAAFTVGRHVVFGPGRYDPVSPRGKMLLAHELAHVVQQRRGGGDPDAGERLPGNALPQHNGHSEGHAHTTAAQAALGRAGPVAGATGVGIARQSKTDEKAAEAATTPMFRFTDEQGQTRLVTPEEGERLKADAVKRMQSALGRVESTAQNWRESHKEHLDMGHAESWGDLWDKPSRIFGVAANIRAGVVPPTLGIWHHPIHVVGNARKALDEGNLHEAARLLRLATIHLHSAKADWNTFIEASIGGAEKLQGELEVVRDTSFAIAIGAGAIVAAPVVAGGVAALGVTGAGATALTAAGTGLATATGGGLLRGTADVAGQKFSAGTVDWSKTWQHVRSHLKEDLVTGTTVGLAPGAGQAAGLGKQGLTTAQSVIRNTAVQSGVTATTGLLGTAADTGLALAEGKSWERARDENFLPGLNSTAVSTASSVVSAPLGSLGQAVGKGRPLLGKAVDQVGGATVAGGSTLAMGGSLEDARANAISSLVTSAAIGRAQQGSDKAAAAKARAAKVSTATATKKPVKAAAAAHADVLSSGLKDAATTKPTGEAGPSKANSVSATKRKAEAGGRMRDRAEARHADAVAKSERAAADLQRARERVERAKDAAQPSAAPAGKGRSEAQQRLAAAERQLSRTERAQAAAQLKAAAMLKAKEKSASAASARTQAHGDSKARAKAAQEARAAKAASGTQSASQQAREKWSSGQRATQAKALGARGHEQLHHAIELAVLDMPEFKGAFTAAELNDISNMRVIPMEVNAADAAVLDIARNTSPDKWPKNVKDAVEMVPVTGGKPTPGKPPAMMPALRQRGAADRPAVLHQSEIRKEWNAAYDALKAKLAAAEAGGQLLPGTAKRKAFIRQELKNARAFIDWRFGAFWGQSKSKAGLR